MTGAKFIVQKLLFFIKKFTFQDVPRRRSMVNDFTNNFCIMSYFAKKNSWQRADSYFDKLVVFDIVFYLNHSINNQ
jgi:hypothetical protein